jgi:hypothetical protein
LPAHAVSPAVALLDLHPLVCCCSSASFLPPSRAALPLFGLQRWDLSLDHCAAGGCGCCAA